MLAPKWQIELIVKIFVVSFGALGLTSRERSCINVVPAHCRRAICAFHDLVGPHFLRGAQNIVCRPLITSNDANRYIMVASHVFLEWKQTLAIVIARANVYIHCLRYYCHIFGIDFVHTQIQHVWHETVLSWML